MAKNLTPDQEKRLGHQLKKIGKAIIGRLEIEKQKIELEITEYHSENQWLLEKLKDFTNANKFTKWILEKPFNELYKTDESDNFIEDEDGNLFFNINSEKFIEYFIQFHKDKERTANNIINKLKQPPKEKISYQWEVNAEKDLPELYELMLNRYKLIAPNTTLKQFTDVFTGQPIDNILAIEWHENNVSELIYFILRLEDSNNIKRKKKADFKKMTKCFVDPNRNTFKAAFKNIKTNVKINLAKDKQLTIDELISLF